MLIKKDQIEIADVENVDHAYTDSIKEPNCKQIVENGNPALRAEKS